MQGFKVLFWLAVICLVIGLAMVYVPGCQPKDISKCVWDADKHSYECPEDK